MSSLVQPQQRYGSEETKLFEKRSFSDEEEYSSEIIVADPLEPSTTSKQGKDTRRDSDGTIATLDEADNSYSCNMDGPLNLTVSLQQADNNNNNNSKSSMVNVVEEEETEYGVEQESAAEPLNSSYARLDQEATKRRERRMSSQLKERAAAFENNNNKSNNHQKDTGNSDSNAVAKNVSPKTTPKTVAVIKAVPVEETPSEPKGQTDESAKPTKRRKKKKKAKNADSSSGSSSSARRRRPMLRKSSSTGTLESHISEGDLLSSQHNKIKKSQRPRRFRRGAPASSGPDVISWSHENSSEKRLQQDKELFKNKFGGGGVKAKMAQLEAVNEETVEAKESFNNRQAPGGRRPRMRRFNSHGSLDTVESSEELEMAALPPFHGFGARGGRRSSIVREDTTHANEAEYEYDEISVEQESDEEYDEVTVDDEYDEITVEDGYTQLHFLHDNVVAYEKEADQQPMEKYSSHSVDTESCVSFYNDDASANPKGTKRNVMDTTNTKNAKMFVEAVAQMYSAPTESTADGRAKKSSNSPMNENSVHTADTDSYDTFFNDEASSNVGDVWTRAAAMPKQRKQKNRLEQFKPGKLSASAATATNKASMQTGHNSVDTESCVSFYNDEGSAPTSYRKSPQESNLDVSSRHSVDTESCATFYNDDAPSVSPINGEKRNKIAKASSPPEVSSKNIPSSSPSSKSFVGAGEESQTSLREEEFSLYERGTSMGDSMFRYNSSDPGLSVQTNEEEEDTESRSRVRDLMSMYNASDPVMSLNTTEEEEAAALETKGHESRHARRTSVSDLKSRFETGAATQSMEPAEAAKGVRDSRRIRSDVGSVRSFKYDEGQNDSEDDAGDTKNGSPEIARVSRRGRVQSDVSNLRSFKHDDAQSGSDDGNNTEDEYVPGGGYRGTFMDFDAQQRAIARRRRRNDDPPKPAQSKSADTNESEDVMGQDEGDSQEEPLKEERKQAIKPQKSGGLEPAQAAQGARNGRRIRSDVTSVKDFQEYYGIQNHQGSEGAGDDLYGGRGFRGCLLDFDAQQRAIARSRLEAGKTGGSKLKERMAVFEKN